MNIAIDVTPMETGHKDRGVGTYTTLLMEALQTYEKKHSYHFFTRGQNVPENADIVHYPYFDPFFHTLPVIKPHPTVVTVADLIPLVFPEHFPSGIRGRIKWQVQRLSLRRATRVITDSDSSKRDIMRIAGISTDAIDVIRLAPASGFRRVTDKALLRAVAAKYELPSRFILYVGDINWNKNIHGLLEAFQKQREGKLVLAGIAFVDRSPESNAIGESIDALDIRGEVIMPGFVPLDDLPVLYSLASVYVQPSHYEGFGLPVLEAMACGCPVISSHASSLSEIAGPAIKIDPNNPDDIASRLRESLTMPADKRLALIQKGILWAKQYSWKKVARQTVQSYEKAIARQA